MSEHVQLVLLQFVCTVCSHAHSLITRTRVALERTDQDGTHWCLKNSLSFTRHVSFRASHVTDHQHKLSLTYLTNLPVVLSVTVPYVGTGSTYLH